MMKKMRGQFVLTVLFLFFVICLCGSMITVGAANLADQCSNDFQKVMPCLSYATGKAATPTKDCCTSTSDIRNSEPECLCYVIQQVHNGSQAIKSLGLQEAKLLQLPSACNLANTSISDCPKLLNISSTSPEYGIFNASSANASTATPAASTSTNNEGSNGFKHGPTFAGPAAIAMAIFFYAFAAGSASLYI